MATATNLYEYYTGQGQALPSIADRSKIYETQGLGSASTYQGTAEQNVALLGKLQGGTTPQNTSGSMPLTPEQQSIYTQLQGIQTQANSVQGTIDAGKITPTVVPAIAPVPSSSPDLSSANAEVAKQTASSDEMVKNYTTALTDATKAYQESQKGLVSKYLSEQKTPAQIRDETNAALGYGPDYLATKKADLAEIESLQKDYDTAKAALDQGILNIENKPISMTLVTGMKAALQKQGNLTLSNISAKINTKLAMMTKSEEYVNQAIDDYTMEQKMRVDEFNAFYDLNKDAFNNITGVYKEAFTLAYNAAQDKLANARTDMKQIMSWVVEYPEANWPKDLSTLTVQDAAAIAGARPLSAENGFTLSAGETRYDANGNVIASRGSEPGAPSPVDIRNRIETLAGYLDDVFTFTSREEALKDLENKKESIILRVGQDGYDQIIAKVNSVFPVQPEAPKITSANTSATQAGQTVAKSPIVTGIKDYGEYFLTGLKDAAKIPTDFLKGLFGR